MHTHCKEIFFFKYMHLHTLALAYALKRTHTSTEWHTAASQSDEPECFPPPRGQTADPGSSAEFMCQLEIAHGAQTLPRTSAIRDELSQHHNLTTSLMILKCCILRWHNCATASVWGAVTASSDSLQCSENMKTDLTLLCRTNKPNRNTQKAILNVKCLS